MPSLHLIVVSLISVIGNMSNLTGTSMDYTDIRYGILLSGGQLDFLRDDCQGFHRSEAMATFVKMAAIEPMHYEKKNFTTEIGIGQFVASTVELAKLWGCDRKTASKVVRLFNEMGILSSEANNRTTVHTIPCLAFWLVKVNGEERTIRNPYYVRASAVNVPKSETKGRKPAVEAPLTEVNRRGIENPDKANGSSNDDSADQSKTSDVVKSGVQGKAKLTGFQSPNLPMTMNEEQFTSATGVHTSFLGEGSILSSQVGQLKDTQPMPITSRPDDNYNPIDKSAQFTGDGTSLSKGNIVCTESLNSNSATIGVEASDSMNNVTE